MALLPPDLLRRLEQLELQAKRRARSTSRGERRSRARGQSVEFADFRNYVPGDDLRYLDWNLYGRLDRLYLKLYEEERELPVHVFLDTSESMGFGAPSKFDYCRRLAAAFGYVALCGFDRVSVTFFPSEKVSAAVRHQMRAVRGRKSFDRLSQGLESLSSGGAASLNASLKRAAHECRQTGFAVVLSDFLDPEGYEAGLEALSGRGFEVLALQVLAPEELNPSTYGDLRLVDSETGAHQDVTFGRYRLEAYRRTVNSYCQRLREFCATRGVRYQLVDSSSSLDGFLLKTLRQMEVWR